MLDHPIHLASIPRRGSSFGMTLPVSEGAATVRQPLPPSAPSWNQLDGCVVLCVDNEPAILDGMRSMLENWQCRVFQASELGRSGTDWFYVSNAAGTEGFAQQSYFDWRGDFDSLVEQD
jgi:hypothetical protein